MAGFLEHLRPLGDILQYRDDQAPLVGQRWKRRKNEGQRCERILPQGPVYLVTTFWCKDPERRHAAAPVQLPTFQVQELSLWRDALAALKERKWHGTGKRVNASYGETDATGHWLKQREWSDVVGDEPIRAVLQAMLPWVDMAEVHITMNADLETR